MDPAPDPTPLLDLVLWRGDGCHLCDDARALLTVLLAQRAAAGLGAPALVERRITDDAAVERELFEQIPVLEYGGRRLPLAIGAGAVRAFLADVLDGEKVAGGGDGGVGRREPVTGREP